MHTTEERSGAETVLSVFVEVFNAGLADNVFNVFEQFLERSFRTLPKLDSSHIVPFRTFSFRVRLRFVFVWIVPT